MANGRKNVFISYSHRDTRWRDELKPHLKSLERRGQLDWWDDTQIESGQRWDDEIKQAIAAAQVAVLLISQHYLASDYIHEIEIPLLSAAANRGEIILLPVVLSPCRFEELPLLNIFQTVNDPSKPLVGLKKADREKIWEKLTRAIDSALAGQREVTATYDLKQAIHSSPSAAPIQARCNLPPPPDLVDRRELLANLLQGIQVGGLVIVKGEGGMGKSALARAAAHAALQDELSPGGAAWVDCSKKTTFETCLREIANVLLGSPMEKMSLGECMRLVNEHLRLRPSLVVLDNFETAIDDVELNQWLAGRRPPSCVMITTREDPQQLGKPIDVRELSRVDGVVLFLKKSVYQGAEKQAELINAICAAVYDCPLAIELLAGMNVPPDGLLDMLKEYGLGALSSQSRVLPDRHRIMSSCIKLSYDRLGDQARLLLQRLSLLPGGAGLEMIRRLPHSALAFQLADELVTKSLCRLENDRYTMHGLVRDFAQHLLEANPLAEKLTVTETLAELAEQKGKQTKSQLHDVAALDWFEAEWSNLMACAGYALDAGQWQLAARFTDSFREFFLNRGHLHDCEQLQRRVVAARQASGDHVGAANSLVDLGTLHKLLGNLTQAESFHRDGLKIRRESGPPNEIAKSLNGLGDVLRMQGEYSRRQANLHAVQQKIEEAKNNFQEGLSIARACHDDKLSVDLMHNLAMCFGDDLELQRSTLAQCSELAQKIQYVRGEAYILRSLGRLLDQQQRSADAIQSYEASCRKFQAIRNLQGEGETLLEMARCSAAQGDLEGAMNQTSRAIALLRETEDSARLKTAQSYLDLWGPLWLESVRFLVHQRKHQEALQRLSVFGQDTQHGMYFAVLCHTELFDLARALEQAEKLMKAYPAWLPARFERGKILSLLGRFEEAGDDLSICQSLDPADHNVDLLLGFNCWRAGRHEQAAVSLRTAREKGSDYLQTILYECIFFMRQRQEDKIPGVVAQTAPRHLRDEELMTTVKWIRGDITDEEHLSYATTPKRKCGIHYWMGEKALAYGDTLRGNQLIGDCLETKATTLFEYQHAVALYRGGRLANANS